MNFWVFSYITSYFAIVSLVSFIRHMINAHGELIYPTIRILLQLVCIKVPDKAEYRNKVAGVCNILKNTFVAKITEKYFYGAYTDICFLLHNQLKQERLDFLKEVK